MAMLSRPSGTGFDKVPEGPPDGRRGQPSTFPYRFPSNVSPSETGRKDR